MEKAAISEYSRVFTQKAECVLLDLWGRLGEYRDHLVLVGGLAPRYITGMPGQKDFSASGHCGTLDIDLGISLAVSETEKYKHIHRILEETGFRYAEGEHGRKSHSFELDTDVGTIQLDFLTTAYAGPPEKRVLRVEHEISAIKVPGLGLAMRAPMKVAVSGKNLKGDLVSEEISVCRPVAFTILKAFAFDGRHKDKDSYDLVYSLQNYKTGPEAAAAEILPEDRKEKSFMDGMAILRRRYESPEHDGPRSYARFCGGDAASAYAAVQEFVSAADTPGT